MGSAPNFRAGMSSRRSATNFPFSLMDVAAPNPVRAVCSLRAKDAPLLPRRFFELDVPIFVKAFPHAGSERDFPQISIEQEKRGQGGLDLARIARIKEAVCHFILKLKGDRRRQGENLGNAVGDFPAGGFADARQNSLRFRSARLWRQ